MLDVNGVLDRVPYVPAHYQRARNATVRLIVVHTAESGEGSTAAEGIARFFSDPAALAASGSVGSAHICVDDDSTVRCAADNQRCNGAAGANDDGLHLEIAGRAGQTSGDWNDDYSRAALERAAQVVAAWCHRHAIPARKLDPAGVKGGAWGVCGHADVSAAFGQSGHYDPGPAFPWGPFLERVNALLTPEVPDMTPDECKAVIRQEVPAIIREEVKAQLEDLKSWFLRKGDAVRAPFRDLLVRTSARGTARVVKTDTLSAEGVKAAGEHD